MPDTCRWWQNGTCQDDVRLQRFGGYSTRNMRKNEKKRLQEDKTENPNYPDGVVLSDGWTYKPEIGGKK